MSYSLEYLLVLLAVLLVLHSTPTELASSSEPTIETSQGVVTIKDDPDAGGERASVTCCAHSGLGIQSLQLLREADYGPHKDRQVLLAEVNRTVGWYSADIDVARLPLTSVEGNHSTRCIYYTMLKMSCLDDGTYICRRRIVEAEDSLKFAYVNIKVKVSPGLIIAGSEAIYYETRPNTTLKLNCTGPVGTVEEDDSVTWTWEFKRSDSAFRAPWTRVRQTERSRVRSSTVGLERHCLTVQTSILTLTPAPDDVNGAYRCYVTKNLFPEPGSKVKFNVLNGYTLEEREYASRVADRMADNSITAGVQNSSLGGTDGEKSTTDFIERTSVSGMNNLIWILLGCAVVVFLVFVLFGAICWRARRSNEHSRKDHGKSRDKKAAGAEGPKHVDNAAAPLDQHPSFPRDPRDQVQGELRQEAAYVMHTIPQAPIPFIAPYPTGPRDRPSWENDANLRKSRHKPEKHKHEDKPARRKHSRTKTRRRSKSYRERSSSERKSSASVERDPSVRKSVSQEDSEVDQPSSEYSSAMSSVDHSMTEASTTSGRPDPSSTTEIAKTDWEEESVAMTNVTGLTGVPDHVGHSDMFAMGAM